MIRPNEIRRGAKALDELLVFAGREAAKMRPSEDRWCGGRYASSQTDPRPKVPRTGHPWAGVSRQTAQTSSVAERLTAVQSPPAGNRNAPERCYPIAPASLALRTIARVATPWRPRKAVLLQRAWIVVTPSRVTGPARRVSDSHTRPNEPKTYERTAAPELPGATVPTREIRDLT